MTKPDEMMGLFDRLWDIPRSITGNGVRKTLSILNGVVPIKQKEYPTGKQVFDWTIPREWNIRDAYILNKKGKKLVDFKENNLHVLGYSTPVNRKVKKEELLKHIYTLPDAPTAIPYLTSYYQERWGFCMEHSRLKKFKDDEYQVVIDSTLEPGSLTLGEGFIRGKSDKEVLFSTYICHPSLANNELSGIIVLTHIYKNLLMWKDQLKYSYRFLYVPETIGAITYLSEAGEDLKRDLIAGYVVTCVGDKGNFTYKRSKQGTSLADRAAINILKHRGKKYNDVDWFPKGSDERQYCSQGFNLPVGSLMRTMYGKYKEYHTSLDNRSVVSGKAMAEAVQVYLDIVDNIETNGVYLNKNPFGEPQLGKRGLYPTLGSVKVRNHIVDKILWLLAYSDGRTDVIDIADKLKMPAKELKTEIEQLVKAGLLEKCTERSESPAMAAAGRLI